MKSSRNIQIDLLKVIALFLVITYHFFMYAKFYELDNYSPLIWKSLTVKVSIAIRIVSLTCVPLFLVISGYLMSYKIKINNNYYKKIVAIYFIYFIATMFNVAADEYRNFNIIHFLLHFISGFVRGYYGWYVNMYFGLYLLAPIFNSYYHTLKTNKNRKKYIFCFVLLVSIPLTLIDMKSRFGRDKVFLHIFPDYWTIIWPLMYYNIGLYLRDYTLLKIKKIFIFFMMIIILIFSEIFYLFFNIKKEALVVHGNIFVLSMTILVFLFVKNIKWNLGKKTEYVISYLSNSTLQAYLLSVIVDIRVYPYLLEFYPSYYERLRVIYIVVPMNILFVILLTIIFNLFIKLIRKTIPLPDYFFR